MTGNASGTGHRILLHSDRPQLFEQEIRQRFPAIELFRCESYEGLPDTVASVRPDIVLSHKFDKEPYPGRPIVEVDSVRWIHAGGTGVDHFRPWDPARITVTNSAGAPRVAMSEFALGKIYALNHYTPHYFRLQQEHRWERGTIRMTEGGTLAVIGLGRIGRAICARARAAGLRVVGVRSRPEPVPEADKVFTPEQISEALSQADYVVVIVPRTDDTIDLIDSEAFAAMKPGALLVNISRGGVVNEQALRQALESGRLRGAALDVFETEPLPDDSPFWDMENVLVTPHVAGFFEGWEKAAAEIFCDNLERWLDGRPMMNVVNPGQGY